MGGLIIVSEELSVGDPVIRRAGGEKFLPSGEEKGGESNSESSEEKKIDGQE